MLVRFLREVEQSMIVCVCHAVSSVHLKVLMSSGVDTVEALGRRCGAGTDCGSCQSQLEQLVEEHHAARSASAVETGRAHAQLLYCRNAEADPVSSVG
jgi:bacterioferritin-associated ferredoxin